MSDKGTESGSDQENTTPKTPARQRSNTVSSNPGSSKVISKDNKFLELGQAYTEMKKKEKARESESKRAAKEEERRLNKENPGSVYTVLPEGPGGRRRTRRRRHHKKKTMKKRKHSRRH